MDKEGKQYVCSKCDESVRFTNLVRHTEKHHKSDGEYHCGLCQELQSTEATGVGYLCCVCDAVLDHPKQLEDHMAAHD
jgi:DNA-directed RNA polymerase subunit RPC12/RpoP